MATTNKRNDTTAKATAISQGEQHHAALLTSVKELLDELKNPTEITEQEKLEMYEYELQIPLKK